MFDSDTNINTQHEILASAPIGRNVQLDARLVKKLCIWLNAYAFYPDTFGKLTLTLNTSNMYGSKP